MADDQPHFVEHFTRLRTGWPWIAGLSLWIAGWIAWQYLPGLPHFDVPPEGERFGLLNFLLSIEATLSMPVLYMAMNLAALRDRAKLDEVLGATRALVGGSVMVEWEYKRLTLPFGAELEAVERQLQQYGQEGWELTALEECPEYAARTYWLKRQREAENEDQPA